VPTTSLDSQIVGNCLACPYRQDRLFCNLSPAAAQALAAITTLNTYSRGAMLFEEGQESKGLFILCSGRVKLSASSVTGKTAILRVAETGAVLGLEATVSRKPYQTTAEVIEPSHVNFVPREPYLRFLREHGEAACRLAEELSNTQQELFTELRSARLARHTEEKLVKFLLAWSGKTAGSEGEDLVRLTLTHEEIGQIIGATRETVTRLLADLKRKNIIVTKGSRIFVKRADLKNLLND
jgi:CRP/FNR family transcriptional regulator